MYMYIYKYLLSSVNSYTFNNDNNQPFVQKLQYCIKCLKILEHQMSSFELDIIHD